MNSQNDKDGSPHIKAAVIAGIFAVIAACISVIGLIIIAFINNGFIFAGAGNQNPYPTTAPISTQIQPTTPSFVPVPQCPSVISRQSLEQWAQVGETSKSEAKIYIDNFDRMRTGGEYKIGDVLPAGVAIVTDFGNGESDIYLTLPVRAIAHYHSWGVFEVTSEYTAVQTGSCMTIMP